MALPCSAKSYFATRIAAPASRSLRPTAATSGRVKTAETVCYEIQRELLKLRRNLPSGRLAIRVHPDVAVALAGHERGVLDEVERELGTPVVVESDGALHVERFEILVP